MALFISLNLNCRIENRREPVSVLYLKRNPIVGRGFLVPLRVQNNLKSGVKSKKTHYHLLFLTLDSVDAV